MTENDNPQVTAYMTIAREDLGLFMFLAMRNGFRPEKVYHDPQEIPAEANIMGLQEGIIVLALTGMTSLYEDRDFKSFEWDWHTR